MATLAPHEEQASPVLRHAEIGGVQDPVVGLDDVPCLLKRLDHLLQEAAMLAEGQALDVALTAHLLPLLRRSRRATGF